MVRNNEGTMKGDATDGKYTCTVAYNILATFYGTTLSENLSFGFKTRSATNQAAQLLRPTGEEL